MHQFDKLGYQPIHLSAQTVCIASLSYLVDKHTVDPKRKSRESEMTPLHFAAKVRHCIVITIIVICKNP